ncbi:MAG: dihydroorotase, partial [Bacteroidota bacterium]
MNILLKSAKIVEPNQKDFHLGTFDILIKNGRIAKIAKSIKPESSIRTVERKNLHVSLGWLDTGVCFGEPGYEERETLENGMNTAAKSGFTNIVLNPNTHPKPDTSSDIAYFVARSQNHLVNVHPLGCLTQNSKGEGLAELYDMHNAGAVGFSDHKASLTNANLLKIALLYAQNFDGLVLSFANDKAITGKGVAHEGEVSTKLGLKGIPALSESLQISRDLFLLEYTGGKLHIPTVSTKESVTLIAAAKKKGLDVSCSVAIHNLVFQDDRLMEFDSHTKCMPPLRSLADSKALIKGVKNGTIDFVTSDHTPLDIEEKRIEFDHAAYGTLGLESAFGSLLPVFGLDTTIALLTKGHERFGIAKPEMKEGAFACLTLFDPETEWTFDKESIQSKSKNSMFIGHGMKG